MPLDPGEDWYEFRVETIDLILSLPLPVNEATVQQTAEIVRDAALLKPKLLHDFINVMRLAPEELHDGESRLIS